MAGVAAECGLTREEAVKHSMAWLKLLVAGKRRAEARRAMIELESLCAVVSAWGGKDAQLKRLQKSLQDAAVGE